MVVTGLVLLESPYGQRVVRNLLKILHMGLHNQKVWSLGYLSVSLATKMSDIIYFVYISVPMWYGQFRNQRLRKEY